MQRVSYGTVLIISLTVIVFSVIILLLDSREKSLSVIEIPPAPYALTELQDEIDAFSVRGKEWLYKNFLEDEGLFVYSFDPATNTYSDSNNAIRQLMASRIMAAEAATNEEALAIHQKNISYLMREWYQEEGNSAYVLYDEKSKLGANAMLLRVLIASPFFEEYKEEAASLARGIYALQHEDGSFEPWYVEPDYDYDTDYLLTFYSGEALLALVEYYEKTGEGYDELRRSADFYINRYVDELDDNYYPAYVPWHTIALAKLYALETDEEAKKEYANAAFVLNDKLLELLDTSDIRGRFYNPSTPQYGTPHSSSDAVYTEGLAYAYALAIAAGDDVHAQRYENALSYAVENLRSLQYTEPRYPSVSDETYIGALRIRNDSSWIRVDTTQHALDAFAELSSILKTQ